MPYGYGYHSGSKCEHMRSILEEQVQALIASMSGYEIARAKSEPRAIHTVYHMVLERAQENRVSILRATFINERALAIEFALAIMTHK
jgi:hypothetical protein